MKAFEKANLKTFLKTLLRIKKNTLNQIADIKMIKFRSVSVIILKMLSVNF